MQNNIRFWINARRYVPATYEMDHHRFTQLLWFQISLANRQRCFEPLLPHTGNYSTLVLPLWQQTIRWNWWTCVFFLVQSQSIYPIGSLSILCVQLLSSYSFKIYHHMFSVIIFFFLYYVICWFHSCLSLLSSNRMVIFEGAVPVCDHNCRDSVSCDLNASDMFPCSSLANFRDGICDGFSGFWCYNRFIMRQTHRTKKKKHAFIISIKGHKDKNKSWWVLQHPTGTKTHLRTNSAKTEKTWSQQKTSFLHLLFRPDPPPLRPGGFQNKMFDFPCLKRG